MPCGRCRRPTTEPRKDLCPGCYLDDWHGREIAGACDACGKADVRVLGRRRIGGIAHTLCGDCDRILGRRRLTLDELRLEVRPPGDRRRADRRSDDRRAPGVGRRAPSWQSGRGPHLGDEQRSLHGRRTADRLEV